MIIYFIRHGETEWNKKGITQGHKDSPLTLKGKTTARKQAELLSGKVIEVIYTSDLGRCVQTAEIINKKIVGAKIIKTEKLRERNFGILNGKPAKIVKEKLDFSNMKQKAPGGESIGQIRNRVFDFIESLKEKREQTILLVAHEGVIRIILADYYKVNYNDKKCDSKDEWVYELEAPETDFKITSLKII